MEAQVGISKAVLDDINGRCNCLAARQASRYLTAAYDQALSLANLRATQFSILHKLTWDGPVTIGELAAAMAMDRTTLSSNLKPLERDGLIAMVPGRDRRVKKVMVTAAGVSQYDMAFPLWLAVQKEFEDQFGRKRAETLRDSLRKVLRSGFSPWAEDQTTP
ncbi:DNA-binding MarR family transcriptional regulator [Paraburkholderia sp. BL6669N2]|uniref:MarR family winged helix-turn-helix transcriptional regulator n=1 Tax=Paraburkholderia sp. BL6669N2 TaxID=1938807 RepID=UPI000E2741D2|nr:MarR family winged helix-turn-helix transcriptional regulator [Paraburkholderia sp. BL6669N2]REG50952.1 DNA-binding MarR family transcriptional regulator [Paraburkholderia sp. BL6669N2]